ncbi:MAG: hypothetical protein K8L99_33045 [Anaerolineae bacterium]|nr:hypothetical protein [Anaerolineae bacterium]
MNYEVFLFTRNQRRDFTAFIRPRELTNKEVSTIASALNYVNDISALTPAWPALYCFAIGQYVLLLRHYDSGRKHAGRSISMLEGIAVKTTRARHFALALPHFLAHQDELLAISRIIDDIETQTVEESRDYPWPNVQAAEVTEGAADELISEFIVRLGEDRLFIPFDEDGRETLIAALSDSRFPTLHFAFGTNSDVLTRLSSAGITVDIVSYFNTTTPSLRDRQTNEITSEISNYVSRKPRPLPQTPTADQPPADLPTPRQSRAAPRHPAQPDPLAQYDAGNNAMLTPRQMARQQAEAERQNAEAEPQSESPFTWLGHLIARLLGRK